MVIKPLENGKSWAVEGMLKLGPSDRQFDVTQTLRVQSETQAWNELRVMPELWVLANTATDLSAARKPGAAL
jgi:hypothetical protein